MVPVAPSFLSPFDVAPSTTHVVPEAANSTPVIVDYWRLIVRERRHLLVPVLLAALIALVVGLRTTPVYEATSSVTFESTKGPVSIQDVGGGLANVSVEDGASEFLETSDVALRVIRDLNLTSRPEFVASGPLQNLIADIRAVWSAKEPTTENQLEERALNYFHDHLKVVKVHQRPLVKVSFQSQDPQLAAAIVNQVPAAFIRADMDARYAATREADQWLNERLAQLKANLDRSEQALAEYRRVNGIVARDSDEGSDRQISILNQRLIDARGRLAAAQDAQKQASSSDWGRVMGTPAIANNPAVARARELQSGAEARLAELRSQMGEAHPQYRKAASELTQAQDDLRRQVEAARREISGELEAARANERQIAASLAAARQTYQNLGSKEIAARQMEQEVQTNRQLYQTFLGRLREVTAAGDFVKPPARLVDPAQVPTSPVKPQLVLMTAIGALLGLLVGFFAIVLMDQIRNTLRRTDDVETKLGRPLLTAIPKLSGASTRKIARMQTLMPDSLYAEAIRTLATSVALAGMEKDMKVVAISSAMDDEGKTAVACNLAAALATTRRVLLLDADLRRPSVSAAMGLPPGTPGLVQLLTRRASLDQCIKSVRSSPLRVLPAGRAASNALDLLMSSRFDKLIAELKKHFDTIIIDCPPVQLVSDTLVLGRAASSMIFVARSDSTPLQVTRRALHRIDKAGIPVLGVALNAHDFAQADRFYGESSGYGHDYAYAYGRTGERRRSSGSRSSSVPTVTQVAPDTQTT